MIFLVRYDRTRGRLISLDRFEDSCREEARGRRLTLEIQCTKAGDDHEVVLLESASERNLAMTHGRYVPDPEERKRIQRDRERAEEVFKVLGNELGGGEVPSEAYHLAEAAYREAKRRSNELFSRNGAEPLT